uniref:Uncharacterized protein n=1 Tax=Avena sativa TaxID=4498 RepID=A0ACD5VVP6_AVESA
MGRTRSCRYIGTRIVHAPDPTSRFLQHFPTEFASPESAQEPRNPQSRAPVEGQGNPPNKRAALSPAAVPGAAATPPGASRDHLTHLPDTILVCILLKLGTKEAIKASTLSRHWRRVWAQIPDLNFDDVGSSVPARALAAYKAHGGDDIHNLTVSLNQTNAQETTAWLSLAAPLLSGRLCVNNRRKVTRETLHLFLREEDAMVRRAAVALPCFKKATEILMDLGFLALALPPAGVFDLLRVVWLEHFWFRGQISISNTVFPSLQKLTIRRVRGLVGLTLNSKSLLYIHLSLLLEIQWLNILASELNKLEVTFCFYNTPTPVASIAAEKLEELRWEVPCVPELKGIPQLRVLGALLLQRFGRKIFVQNFLIAFQQSTISSFRLGLV